MEPNDDAHRDAVDRRAAEFIKLVEAFPKGWQDSRDPVQALPALEDDYMTLRDMKLCVFALAGATVPAWRNKKRSELKEILEGGVDGVREMRAKLKEDTSAQMKMLGWELASPAPPPPPPPPAPSKTSDLTTMLESGEFSDVRIAVNTYGGKVTYLPAHRNVLAHTSEYFAAAFRNVRRPESGALTVTINAGSVETVKAALGVLYGGKMSELCKDINVLADVIQIFDSISDIENRDAAIKFLSDVRLDDHNVGYAYTVSMRSSLPEAVALFERALAYIRSHSPSGQGWGDACESDPGLLYVAKMPKLR